MSKADISSYAEQHYARYARPPDYYIDVGCGKCHSCQVKRLAGYRMRLRYELEKYPNSLFITLSFNDDALEEYKDNYNRAVTQFLDALRKEYKHSIRHFFVCEFGTLHGRPHYHGLLINVPWLDFYKVESIWNRGNGKLRKKGNDKYIGFFRRPRGIIYLEAIRDYDKISSYIAKYMTKEFHSEKQPRILTSRDFGAGYLTKSVVSMHKKQEAPYLAYNGKKFPLPRFYLQRIFTQAEKDKMTSDRWLYPIIDEENQKVILPSVPEPKYIGDQIFYPLWQNGCYIYPGYDDALKVFANQQRLLGLSPVVKSTIKIPKKEKINNLLLIPNYEFE